MKILGGIAALILLLAGCSASAKPGPTVIRSATVESTITATATATATVTARPVVRKVVATRTRVVRVTYTPPPPKQYGEGTYVIGVDIKPGTYHTSGADICYWARLSSLSTDDIIDNGNTTGPATIQVRASDKALQIQGDCTFGRIKL